MSTSGLAAIMGSTFEPSRPEDSRLWSESGASKTVRCDGLMVWRNSGGEEFLCHAAICGEKINIGYKTDDSMFRNKHLGAGSGCTPRCASAVFLVF